MPETVLVTEEFVQAPLPAVDLLWVVDDTASMAREQDALADHLPGLVADLAAAGVDWHAGVVATDMGGADAGWLVGSPFVLTPTTPDVAQALASAARVGTDGAGPEAGLAAATRALELMVPGGPNAGFRRVDAALHVVFVSDADDSSDAWLGPDPVSAFLAVLADATMFAPAPMVSAIVGDVPLGCSSDLGTAAAAPRYHAVVAQTGGATVSVCDVDLGGVVDALGDASLQWPTVFGLRERPVPGSIRVTIDGVRLDEGFVVFAEPPRVEFDVAPPPGALVTFAYLVEVAP